MRISILVALLLPITAFAQSVSFPSVPLWVSNTTPQSGQQIHIYTVLYNGASDELSGSLRFFIDEETLSSQDVSLAAGTSRIVSTSWKVESGSHNFYARFIPLSESENSVDTSNVTVTAVEPPSPIVQAVSDAKNTATEVINSSSPIVQEVAQSVFAKSEEVREAGIEYFQSKIEPPVASTATTSNVTGFLAPSNSASSTPSALHKASQLAASAALFTFQNRWIYYSLVVLVFYLLIRFAIGWVNRPRF